MSNITLKDLNILFVEDEDIIRQKSVSTLKYIVANVKEASNGLEALEKLKTFCADLIITDLHMPDMDGVEFIKKVREHNKNICIIVQTAYTTEKYLLSLIDMHIEKYLIKPTSLEKLIEALEYCIDSISDSKISYKKLPNGYEYDWNQKSLIHNKKSIALTKKEILFLELLFKNINNITTYEELQNEVWQDVVMTDNALRSLVRNLRKKLPKDFIINLSGVGYKVS
ncbi:two-component system response regulator [Malaciobacter molluscorum LMG 25693]|uniref:Two-component system response regulator n=1 Tax=Malaciobacter molluscorum LMG 25693 TaxID=870501 RepID=A0AB33H0M1_9BACT|nr:response regulator transcription factor [Malaciobacter molluscorum]AXX92681.1 two-component system response regulator [Malaciobacter molluscorum LMG 25693]